MSGSRGLLWLTAASTLATIAAWRQPQLRLCNKILLQALAPRLSMRAVRAGYSRNIVTTGVLAALFGAPLLAQSGSAEATSTQDKPEEGPQNFTVTRLWASSDGETHMTDCALTGFEIKRYSDAEQYVLTPDVSPTKVVFTELAIGLDNPWHNCPAVQYVVTLSGSWYVRTSDGNVRTFTPGHVLFQDNVKNLPGVDKQAVHYSGVDTDANEPCRQLILQVDVEPVVGQECSPSSSPMSCS